MRRWNLGHWVASAGAGIEARWWVRDLWSSLHREVVVGAVTRSGRSPGVLGGRSIILGGRGRSGSSWSSEFWVLVTGRSFWALVASGFPVGSSVGG